MGRERRREWGRGRRVKWAESRSSCQAPLAALGSFAPRLHLRSPADAVASLAQALRRIVSGRMARNQKGDSGKNRTAKAKAKAAAASSAAATTPLDDADPKRRRQLQRRDTEKIVERTLASQHFRYLDETSRNHKVVNDKTLRQVLTDAYHELFKGGRIGASFLSATARQFADGDMKICELTPSVPDLPICLPLYPLSVPVSAEVDAPEAPTQRAGRSYVSEFGFPRPAQALFKPVRGILMCFPGCCCFVVSLLVFVVGFLPFVDEHSQVRRRGEIPFGGGRL